MEKYFVTYPQAVALKELGFKERTNHYFENGKFKLHPEISGWDFNTSFITCVSRPTKSQVFEWFRKNHLLGHEINCPFGSYSGKKAFIRNEGRYEMFITDEDQLSLPEDIFYSTDYFEAESKAIDILINLVKNK